MKRPVVPWIVPALLAVLGGPAVPGLGQESAQSVRQQMLDFDDFDDFDDPSDVESEATKRLRELRSPEALEKARDDRLRPPFEFYRTQVAPFDVLPFIKPHHWITMSQELEANLNPYDGWLRTAPVKLQDMPRAILFEREARLLKQQAARLSFEAMLPSYSRMIDINLVRPEAIRADDGTQAPLRLLETHQMLVVLLAEEPSAYQHWSRFQAFIPATTDTGDPIAVENRRYYRLVTFQEPEKPPVLSGHPLTWTTISHVVWDDLDPNRLNLSQQNAMLDWLHWGGQLIITGGATRTLALISHDESFLAPYLPAEPAGDNTSLNEGDLRNLALRYPPPGWATEVPLDDEMPIGIPPQQLPPQLRSQVARRYENPVPIRLPANRPLYLANLRPRTEDAVIHPLGDENGNILAIERRVGRGRILMLGFDPKEPAIVAWRGFDTVLRRLLLRRPEDPWNPNQPNDKRMLAGPDLTWVRYLGRDLDPPTLPTPSGPTPGRPVPINDEEVAPQAPVAAWLDAALMPTLSREALVKSSGIEVPGSRFVLKVMLGYLIALVPLNWLLCRFVLRRRELAWAIVPVLSLGFAIAVERAAAFDMGYDSACDEIDLLEFQPGYHRAHLNRFAVLYSTGRQTYTMSYPRETQALALPLNTGLSIPGEEITESTFQSLPFPSLKRFRVEPRSLAMFRAEQLLDFGGPIALASDGSNRLINATRLPLRDAVLIDTTRPRNDSSARYLGDIGPGAIVDLESIPDSFEPDPDDEPEPPFDWIDQEPFFNAVKNYAWNHPADQGEIRLVAWVDEPMPAQEVMPEVDRHRGFTIVVAHLTYGPPPSPDSPTYDLSRNTPRRNEPTGESGMGRTIRFPPREDMNRGDY